VLGAAMGAGTGMEEAILPSWDMFTYLTMLAYDRSGCWQPGMSAHSPLSRDNAHVEAKWTHRVEGMQGASAREALRRWDEYKVPRHKIVLGMGMFGRSWTGLDSELAIGSSYGWCGAPGQWTREPGLLAYYEVVQLIRMGARTMLEKGSETLYLTHGTQFVSFEAEMTIRLKVDFLLRKGLGGAALWSADLDDYLNGHILTTYVYNRLEAEDDSSHSHARQNP